MQRRRRLNPTEDQERRAAAVLRAHYKREYTPATLPTASADYDMAVDLANRILAGEEVAEALAGTGLVVDMSPQPAQIAEIETSQGVIEVPVAEAPQFVGPSIADAVQAIDRATHIAKTAARSEQTAGLREGVQQLLARMSPLDHKKIAAHYNVDLRRSSLGRLGTDQRVRQIIENTVGSAVDAQREAGMRSPPPAPDFRAVRDAYGSGKLNLLFAFRQLGSSGSLLADYLHSLPEAEIKKIAKNERATRTKKGSKAELIDALVREAERQAVRGRHFLMFGIDEE